MPRSLRIVQNEVFGEEIQGIRTSLKLGWPEVALQTKAYLGIKQGPCRGFSKLQPKTLNPLLVCSPFEFAWPCPFFGRTRPQNCGTG